MTFEILLKAPLPNISPSNISSGVTLGIQCAGVEIAVGNWKYLAKILETPVALRQNLFMNYFGIQ